MKIKICGQNNPAIINHCLDLNISYQGLIFYEKIYQLGKKKPK